MRSESTGSPVGSMLRAGRRRDAGSRGFSLIECLAALTILAVGLATLLQSYTRSLATARNSKDYAAASVLALSLLAETQSGAALGEGTRDGRSGGYAWQIDVVPSLATGQVNGGSGLHIYRILVRVMWDGSRRLQLETMQMSRRR